jgi:predicted dehydrogenase
MMSHTRREIVKGLGAALAYSFVPSMTLTNCSGPAARPPIKIGQIGVGHVHAYKLGVYRASTDYEVVGIVEPDDELRREAEKQPIYRGLRWLTQEQLLNVSGLQAVLIETRVRDVLDVSAACVGAGKHIHLDKPPGESLSQLRGILESAARRNLLVQMGYMYRYNPGVVLLRDFVSRGWLGDVFEIDAVISRIVEPPERRGMAEYRGGMMFELGCHFIDLLISLMGKPTKVTAFRQHAARIEDRLMDNTLAVFEYPHALATIKSTAMEIEGFERRHFVVCGTEGTFHIQPLDDPPDQRQFRRPWGSSPVRVALSTPRDHYRKGYQEISLPRYTRYVDDAADMARIIRGEKSADFPYEHDLTVQAAVLQACGLELNT